jgi:hypothetical protein
MFNPVCRYIPLSKQPRPVVIMEFEEVDRTSEFDAIDSVDAWQPEDTWRDDTVAERTEQPVDNAPLERKR